MYPGRVYLRFLAGSSQVQPVSKKWAMNKNNKIGFPGLFQGRNRYSVAPSTYHAWITQYLTYTHQYVERDMRGIGNTEHVEISGRAGIPYVQYNYIHVRERNRQSAQLADGVDIPPRPDQIDSSHLSIGLRSTFSEYPFLYNYQFALLNPHSVISLISCF